MINEKELKPVINTDNYVSEFANIPGFSERIDKLSSWLEQIYGTKKVLVFYRCANNPCYSIYHYKGINKNVINGFEFYEESVIELKRVEDDLNKCYESYAIKNFHWLSSRLRKKLMNEGLEDIIPFWHGSKCYGGALFAKNSINSSESAKVFENNLRDIAYFLEIAYQLRLRNQEAWEKKVILEVGRKISEFKDLQTVLGLIIDSLKEVIHYDAAGIFLVKMPARKIISKTVRGYTKKMLKNLELKVGKGIIGWSMKHMREVNVRDVRKDTRYVSAKKETRSELAVPIIFGKKILGVFNLESNEPHFFTYQHIDLLKTFAAQTAIVLENSKLFYKTLEIKQIKKEFEIAKDVQKALLPQKLPVIDGYDFAAKNISSFALGGDLYDFVNISKTELGVAIGDVSGKGVVGAVLMASLYSTFRSELRKSHKPKEAMFNVNNSLYEQTEADKFATFFYGYLNMKEHYLEFTNAGHNRPFHIKNDGEWHELSTGGPMLGFLPDMRYESNKVTLEKGDIILMYTDGVSETFNDREQEFGEERILNSVLKNKKLSAEAIVEILIEKVKRFTQRAHLDDDITLVVIKKT